MLALYRKYRPQTFRAVIGQEFVVKPLLNSIAANRISHAYLFSGPHGAGKTSMSKIFAKAVNCLNPQNGDACNECKNCQLINQNKAIDVLEVDGASNNGVEEVRGIIEQLKFFPAVLSHRVYIIDEAQMLSNAAWNAFLKTLEEPPKDVIFIFTTTEPNKVPITVMSRCQRFQFSRLDKTELVQLLDHVTTSEQILITPQAQDILINLADGSARDALSILDQLVSFGAQEIDVELINSLFGLAKLQDKVAFLTAIKEDRLPEANAIVSGLLSHGLDGNVFCQDLAKILMDCLMWIKSQNPDFLRVIDVNTIRKLGLSEQVLLAWIPILIETDAKIKKYAQDSFYLELMSFEMNMKKC